MLRVQFATKPFQAVYLSNKNFYPTQKNVHSIHREEKWSKEIFPSLVLDLLDKNLANLF